MKELDEQLKNKYDLKLKYPQYFTEIIFLVFMLLIVAVAVADFGYNNWELNSVSYYCPAIGGVCPNPFYNNTNTPAWICEKIPCDEPFLTGGFKVGREDFLSKQRFSVIFLIILMAFIFNHIIYMFKFETFKYRGKDWHLKNGDDWKEKMEKQRSDWEVK